MRKDIHYLVLLNCILIEEDVRECFLFWCKKTIKVIDYINKVFPNLIVNKDYSLFKEFKTSDVIIVSKRIVQPIEYDSHAKLGKLLGYISSDNFETLNRDALIYDYSFEAYINNKRINLFNEMSQNKLNHSIMFNKIKEAFKRHKYGDIVDEVILNERVVIPALYLIDKLEKNQILTNEEIDQLQNFLWNESLDSIYNKNLLNNETYRKLMINILKRFRSNSKEYVCMTDEEVKKTRDEYLKLINL
jgi:hypothetical protein